MRVPSIKEVMHEPCMFLRYETGSLWYQISYTYSSEAVAGGVREVKVHHGLFDFPIPVDDAGDGAFGIHEKAVTLMRWIRKHIEFLNKVKEE